MEKKKYLPYFFTQQFNELFFDFEFKFIATQPAITCSKLTIETLEQGVKYVQS